MPLPHTSVLRQFALHPSPLTVLLSSHSSVPARTPSPHRQPLSLRPSQLSSRPSPHVSSAVGNTPPGHVECPPSQAATPNEHWPRLLTPHCWPRSQHSSVRPSASLS